LEIWKLEIQKPLGRIDANNFSFDIDLNADIVRHRDQKFTTVITCYDQNLDSARSAYSRNLARSPSIQGLGPTTSQLPFVEVIFRQLDSLACRNRQL